MLTLRTLFRKLSSHRRGLTLIEAVIGVALFAMISVALYTTWTRVMQTARAAQTRTIAVALANEQFEIARNLPYSDVGTIAGIPSGLISPVQTLVRSGMTFIATTTVRNVDLPFDGTIGGAPEDLSPADNKLVEIEITCITCPTFRPVVLSTNIAPKNLESASTNGSLFVRVYNKASQPILGADVHIYNPSLVPTVDILDVTATSGMLQLIDAPPAAGSYQVTVSKAGYSTEQTRGAPTTTNPVTPHANVNVQAVTQLTFYIDLLATLNFSSVNSFCGMVPNVGTQMTGAKIISTAPDVPKYDNWFSTGGSGARVLNDIEYDNYTIVASSTTHDLAGIIPLSPMTIEPGATQNVQLILAAKNGKAVLITVKEAVGGLPIAGADVTIKLQPAGASTTLTTGRGFLRQTDWSGGSGQLEFADATRYQMDDTNVDTTSFPGEVRLTEFVGYPASGMLESSIFDTGAPSNFYQFTFLPTGQPPDTGMAPVLFQFSTGVATTSMGPYLGPDGTASTYYSSTSTVIAAIHDNDRYARYKMFLTTASTTLTPSVTDAMFTFTSSCVPPGQVIFQALADGTYDLHVEAAGYQSFDDVVIVDAGTLWQEVPVNLVL